MNYRIMLKGFVEKFYNLIFADEDAAEKIPYGNKLFMFWFSVISFLIVAVLIGLDIAQNISENI